MTETKKFKINTKDCNPVLKTHHGKIVEVAIIKATGEPIKGVSGNTTMYSIGNGMGVFLEDSQVIAL